MGFKARVFLDKAGQPRMARETCGEIWVHYLHPDNKWVTLQKVSSDSAHFMIDNLNEKEQACYPPIDPTDV